MITKERLKKHIDSFPDSLEIDDLIRRLRFIELIESRIQNSKEESDLSEEQLESEMKTWFE